MKTYVFKITALDENGYEVPVMEGEKFIKHDLKIEADFDGFLLIGTTKTQQTKVGDVNAQMLMSNIPLSAISTCLSAHPYLFMAADAAVKAGLAGAKRPHGNKGETK